VLANYSHLIDTVGSREILSSTEAMHLTKLTLIKWTL